jgi:Putative lumazine-binding
MPNHPDVAGLTDAVQRYFDLMYDSDVARFDRVFRSTAQLHGFREGQMTMWPAATFKEIIAGRPSPKSQKAPREEEILLIDFASADQALAKVRVRINAIVFVDHLTYHRIDGEWLITAKAFHVERHVS